jgi:hypothetical protein
LLDETGHTEYYDLLIFGIDDHVTKFKGTARIRLKIPESVRKFVFESFWWILSVFRDFESIYIYTIQKFKSLKQKRPQTYFFDNEVKVPEKDVANVFTTLNIWRKHTFLKPIYLANNF